MKPVPIYCNTPIIRKLVSWGEKAFQKPKKKINNGISIGYAACHWCHVMEKKALKMWLPNI
jgi:uncharacterized protein YyaL (SSP411 family)